MNSLAHPELFAAGQRGIYFTFKLFWVWVMLSIYHGLICYWIPMLGF